MKADPLRGLTLILDRARGGDEQARDELLALVYDELRRVASRLMRRERADHTLSPTAVVHEAVIRLLGESVFDKAADRSFLLASAARSMREVLIDHARRRAAGRRGGGRRRVALDSVVDYFEGQKLDRRGGPRGPRPAGRAERAAGAGHDPAVLRRNDRPRSGRGPGSRDGDGRARLAAGAGLACRRAWRSLTDDTGALARDRRSVQPGGAARPCQRAAWLRMIGAAGTTTWRPRSPASWPTTIGPAATASWRFRRRRTEPTTRRRAGRPAPGANPKTTVAASLPGRRSRPTPFGKSSPSPWQSCGHACASCRSFTS